MAVASGEELTVGLEQMPMADQVNALIQSANNPTAPDSLKVKAVGVLGILGKRQSDIESNKVGRVAGLVVPFR